MTTFFTLCHFTFQGRHEIISLSGSFLASDSGGTSTRKAGGLSVSLADADGKVVGGGVVGMLIAASPVQVLFSMVENLLLINM